MARADKNSLERKKIEIYSDFLNDFDLNPITGLLGKVTNEDSVKQSLRNICLTIVGERFYDSNKGSKIRQSLFENYDPLSLETIKRQLLASISAYEPRATMHDVRINEDVDKNGYNISIVFSIINIPEDINTISLFIRRVR